MENSTPQDQFPTTAGPRRRLPNRAANTPRPQGQTVPQQPVPPGQPQTPPAQRMRIGLPPIKDLLNNKLGVIQSVIPAESKVTATAIVTNVLATIYEEPNLKLCTPKSVLLAVLAGARFGFSFCGDDAYLIPYEISKEDPETHVKAHLEWRCSFMAGYRGYIELAARNGYTMYSQDVWSGDKISILAGTEHNVRHEMALGGRGDLVGAYCIVRDAQDRVVNFSRIMFEEITLLYRRTPSWKNWPGRMVMRSAVKRSFTTLPKKHQDMKLLDELDNRAENGQDIGDLVGVPEGAGATA